MNIYDYAAQLRANKSLSGLQKTNMLLDMANQLQLSEQDLLGIPGLTPEMIQQGLKVTGRTLAPAQPAPIVAQPAPSPGLPPVPPAPLPAATAPPVVTSSPMPAAAGQPYGLSGAEDAVFAGTQYGLSLLDQAGRQVASTYQQGTTGLKPFIQSGGRANDLMAAFSGALGPEAQAKAYADYQSSPAYQYALEQGEKALTRNAAATGNLGGGNLSTDLLKHAVGTYLGDFNNQYQNLAQVSGSGLSAATTQAGLSAPLASLQAGLGQTGATLAAGGGYRAGDYRNQAGRDIANAISGTVTGIGNLINQQGAGLADIVGTGTNNISNLINSAASGDAAAQEQMAVILANLAAQSGSVYSSQPLVPGVQTNYLGQVGQLASGIGGMLQYSGANGLQPAGTYSPVYNQTTGFWQAPSMIG